ncbi:MAG: hypothetical protein RLZZ519_1532 [Bacteroidota bacterium]|jgi:hypothetical protein
MRFARAVFTRICNQLDWKMRKFTFKGIVAPIMALIVVIGLNQTLNAQMHRPILEDVFTLYNLLHRDYSQAEEPEVKQKRIEEDRATVIAVLRNYVREEDSKLIDSDLVSADPEAPVVSGVNVLLVSVQNPANPGGAPLIPNTQYHGDLISKPQLEAMGFPTAAATGIKRNQMISSLQQLQLKLRGIRKNFEKEALAVAPTNTNFSNYVNAYNNAILNIDDLLLHTNQEIVALTQSRDDQELDELLKLFSSSADPLDPNPLENELLKKVVAAFKTKYATDHTADRSFGEVQSSGQKAALGFPGIASSAPMVVDVINQILVEEIKAEVATSALKFIKKGFASNPKIEDLKTAGEKLKVEGTGVLYIHASTTIKVDGESMTHTSAMEMEVADGQEIEIVTGSATVTHGASTILQILATLFPETKEFVEHISDQDLAKAIDMLKGKIRSDLKKLLPNLGKLEQNVPWVHEMIIHHPEAAIAFSAIELMNQLQTIKHPVEVFGIIPESKAFSFIVGQSNSTTDQLNLAAVARLMELLSYSLIVEENGANAWVSLDFLEKYLDKPDFYRLYFGLLLAQDNLHPKFQITWNVITPTIQKHRIVIKIADKVDDLLESKTIDKVRTIFSRLTESASYVNEQALSIRQAKAKGQSPTAETVHQYAFAIANMIDSTRGAILMTFNSLDLITLMHPTGCKNFDPNKISNQIHAYCNYLRTSSEIYLHLNDKQYSEAISKAIELIRDVVHKNNPNNPFEKLFEREDTDWMRLTDLLVAIGIAEDREDLEEAFKQFAHNPGSWRVKRESCFNVALSVYGGGFSGWEKFQDKDFDYQTTYVDSSSGSPIIRDTTIALPIDSIRRLKATISLSIGPSISTSFRIKNHNFSLTAYAPLIDIGAVTAFRFNDTTTTNLPDFKWEDIVAPGIFGYLGFPSMPISFGFGAQYSPRLRRIQAEEDGTLHTVFAKSFRYGFSLAIDLSLLDFHTSVKKPRKYK